jgi:low affinity Fe/Cu permease
MNESFHRLARRTAEVIGSGGMFVFAVLLVIGWAFAGPTFQFSDTWQLFINTFTTIATFLTVVLIQNSQNRDAKALHLKLDELIRAGGSARNQLLSLENMTEEELNQLEAEFVKLRDKSMRKRKV